MAVQALIGLNLLAVIFFEFALSFSWKTSFKRSSAGIITVIIFICVPELWHLQRNLNLVARDFKANAEVSVISTAWKSFAKVQLLNLHTNNYDNRVVAIGDGTGIAKVRPYKEPLRAFNLISVDLASYANPKKVAVLFAGAGPELIRLHQNLGTDVQTWGVEINSKIPQMIAKDEGSDFTDFFKKYKSQYVISDNRRFLESTSEKFDAIIYSWSGATVANFSGAIIHTTQYSFTKEGLQAAVGHLEKNGILVILGGNKLNIIKNLKILESKNIIQELSKKILMFNYSAMPDWKKSWDDFAFVYKNENWMPDEIEKIRSNTYAKLLVSPELNTSIYSKYLAAQNSEDFAKNLWRTEGIYPVSATDDYPFAYRNTPSFTENLSQLEQKIFYSVKGFYYQPIDALVCTGFIFAFIFLFSIFKIDHFASVNILRFLAWAPISSAALLFFLYKAILFFGDPTTAYLTVQVATQVGSILGLLAATRTKNLKFSILAFAAAASIFIGTLLILQDQQIYSFIFHLNFMLSLILFTLLIAVTSFLLSFYFLSNLTADTVVATKNFGLFWAFETLLTGVFSLYGVVLIEEQGIQSFVINAILISCGMIACSYAVKLAKIKI